MGQWTQAVCDPCWEEYYPLRRPTRVLDADLEVCCYCGNLTTSGIYLRADPASVPYPRIAPEDKRD